MDEQGRQQDQRLLGERDRNQDQDQDQSQSQSQSQNQNRNQNQNGALFVRPTSASYTENADNVQGQQTGQQGRHEQQRQQQQQQQQHSTATNSHSNTQSTSRIASSEQGGNDINNNNTTNTNTTTGTLPHTATIITVDYVYSDQNRPDNPNRTGSLVLSLPATVIGSGNSVSIQEMISMATQMAYSLILSHVKKKKGITLSKFQGYEKVRLSDILPGSRTCSICLEELSPLEEETKIDVAREKERARAKTKAKAKAKAKAAEIDYDDDHEDEAVSSVYGDNIITSKKRRLLDKTNKLIRRFSRSKTETVEEARNQQEQPQDQRQRPQRSGLVSDDSSPSTPFSTGPDIAFTPPTAEPIESPHLAPVEDSLASSTSETTNESNAASNMDSNATAGANASETDSSRPVYLSDYTGLFLHIPIKLPCSHIFGQDCLFEWLKENSTCPLCRESLADPEGEANGASARARAGANGNDNNNNNNNDDDSGPTMPTSQQRTINGHTFTIFTLPTRNTSSTTSPAGGPANASTTPTTPTASTTSPIESSLFGPFGPFGPFGSFGASVPAQRNGEPMEPTASFNAASSFNTRAANTNTNTSEETRNSATTLNSEDSTSARESYRSFARQFRRFMRTGGVEPGQRFVIDHAGVARRINSPTSSVQPTLASDRVPHSSSDSGNADNSVLNSNGLLSLLQQNSNSPSAQPQMDFNTFSRAAQSLMLLMDDGDENRGANNGASGETGLESGSDANTAGANSGANPEQLPGYFEIMDRLMSQRQELHENSESRVGHGSRDNEELELELDVEVEAEDDNERSNLHPLGGLDPVLVNEFFPNASLRQDLQVQNSESGDTSASASTSASRNGRASSGILQFLSQWARRRPHNE